MFSPKTTSGSFLYSALAHGALFGGAILVFSLSFMNRPEPQPIAEEIAYETFSEPPAPAEVSHHIARQPDPEVPKQPQTPIDTAPHELQDNQSTIAGTQAAAKSQTTIGSEGTGDATATPYYKIKPKYPRAALTSGVEGWVLLRIDVNEKGEVENIRVIGGKERSMFENEARRAVEKWKYKPFLNAQGAPEVKKDHEVRVDFKLQDAA